jgi:sirohydrochlorin ferrochelatase
MTAPAAPILLAVAHGTRDPAGIGEIRRLVELVRRARPELAVRLCWLELAEPLLPEALSGCTGPVVVVPLLLSTGYHVKTDIAAAVAGRPQTAMAAQLGPDPRIAAAVLDRLHEVGGPPGAGVALVGSGSSDPEAAENLAVAAGQLEQQAGCPVYPRFLTDPRWRAGLPPGVAVASYLLAPGFFAGRLAELARTELGSDRVAAPIGAHPAVVEVIADRYAEAARTLRPDIPG